MADSIKSYSFLSGAIFGQFRKEKGLVNRHQLDTDREQYVKTIQQIVIPEFMKLTSDVPNYPQRVQKLINYTLPAMNYAWYYSTELFYRIVADKEHQTPENMTKAYILRSIGDLLFSWATIIDDFSDDTSHRFGKPSWFKVCEGGINAAVYDAFQMSSFLILLLKQHFKDEPGYTRMIEILSMGIFKMTMGQVFDLTNNQRTVSPTMANWTIGCNYKTGHYTAVGPALALIFAGVTSEEVIDKTIEMFTYFGWLFQIWDDFNDYYCSMEEAGKPGTDIPNGCNSWTAAKAIEVFSPAQLQEFKECHGSKDPEKIKRVCKLYDEVDMPKLFVEKSIEVTKLINKKIDEMPHPRVQEACRSYLHWLVGQEILNVAAKESS